MAFADRMLTCRDCNETFAFTAGEQEFYASRGLVNEPSRCPDCRRAYRAQRDNRGGGGAPRQKFSVTCTQCGSPAEVPFQPRGDKPVLCDACYAASRPPRRTY